MKRNHRTSEPGRIEALARQATDYALHMMRTAGSVPPTVIADTESGYVFCMPTALTDEATKDHFAEVARLFAIAHSARALVLIAEAWATLPDASGHLDTETPPSMAPNRQEIVALMLEDGSVVGHFPRRQRSAGSARGFALEIVFSFANFQADNRENCSCGGIAEG